jgi:hypothetical protein
VFDRPDRTLQPRDEGGHLLAERAVRNQRNLSGETEPLEVNTSQQQGHSPFGRLAERAQPMELERRDQDDLVSIGDDISSRFNRHHRG